MPHYLAELRVGDGVLIPVTFTLTNGAQSISGQYWLWVQYNNESRGFTEPAKPNSMNPFDSLLYLDTRKLAGVGTRSAQDLDLLRLLKTALQKAS